MLDSVEPLAKWAIDSASYRPSMTMIQGALCGEGSPGPRGGFLVNGHRSGFTSDTSCATLASVREDRSQQQGGGAGAGTEVASTITCHRPTSLMGALGLRHVDLFVLDCEGCELSVAREMLEGSGGRNVEVDVWVIEANEPSKCFPILLLPLVKKAGLILSLLILCRGSDRASPLPRVRASGVSGRGPRPYLRTAGWCAVPALFPRRWWWGQWWSGLPWRRWRRSSPLGQPPR